MKIERLDHIVLTVRGIETTCAFYTKVLGMKETTFGGGRKALSFGNQKINLHEAGKEIEPKAISPTPGSADLCFVASAPLLDVIKHVQSGGTKIIEGPIKRYFIYYKKRNSKFVLQ